MDVLTLLGGILYLSDFRTFAGAGASSSNVGGGSLLRLTLGGINRSSFP